MILLSLHAIVAFSSAPLAQPAIFFTSCAKKRAATRPALNIFDKAKQAVDGAKQVVDGAKAAYEDDEFVPDGFVRASHILFLDSEGGAAEKAAALKQRIEAGEISFGDAALAFSNCPTRDLNGRLGIFQSLSRLTEGTLRTDSMPYDGQDTLEFDSLCFSADLGQVESINTQWGTHLVLVEERGGLPPPDLLSKSYDAGVSKAADFIKQAMGTSDAGAAPQVKSPTNGFGGAGPVAAPGASSSGPKSTRGKKKKKKKR